MPTPIMIEDAAELARRDFRRYPHAELVWVKIDNLRYAFGRTADGSDVEFIDIKDDARELSLATA